MNGESAPSRLMRTRSEISNRVLRNPVPYASHFRMQTEKRAKLYGFFNQWLTFEWHGNEHSTVLP